MHTNVFVGLTTEDLERSKAFYEALGWSINPLFTDDNAACVVIDENVFFMVMRREFFATFTDKQIADPRTQAQFSVSLTCDSRADVDSIMQKGLDAGGTEPREAQDYGFMYSRDLEDPDGNALGFLYMVPDAAEKGSETHLADEQSA